MSGLPGWGYIFADGWYQQGAGFADVFLAVEEQGFLSAATDTPANTLYLPDIVNAAEFCIDHQPGLWFEGDSERASTYAAVGRLELRNRHGRYTFLTQSDAKNARLVFKAPIANAVGTLAGAPTVATAILEDADKTDDGNIVLILKDTMARMQRTSWVKTLPPFVDSGAANRRYPQSFGAIYQREPLPIDEENGLYLLHDGQVTNIVAVRDKGARLDANATPPQYVLALNGSGLQLAAPPIGKLTVDCSSEGSQATIPGAEDVLAGLGLFASWSGLAPAGWTWSNNTGSVITKLGTPNYPQNYIALLGSTRPWNVLGNRFGDVLQLTSGTPLKAGRAYRIQCQIWDTFGNAPYAIDGLPAGLMLRSAISFHPEDAISPHGLPITVPLIGRAVFTFLHRVPAGADRNIYVHAVSAQGSTPTTGQGVGGGKIYNLKIQELGQLIDVPMTGTTLAKYWDDILYAREGETDAYEPNDLVAIDDATGYDFGVAFDEPTNVDDQLYAPFPSFGCFRPFTDALGLIRARRFVAPEEATIVAAFDLNCVDRNSIVTRAFKAPALTTSIGIRHNCSISADSDMVSDTSLLPADERTRFKRTSQYIRTSSINPAQAYAYAVGADPFDSVLVDPVHGQTEIDRIIRPFSPGIINGIPITGERNLVDFDVYYDDLLIGIGPTIAPHELLGGDGFTLTAIDDELGLNFNQTRMIVVGWKPYPYGGKMTITGLY